MRPDMEYDFKKAAERMTERRRTIILQKGTTVEGLSRIEPEKKDSLKVRPSKTAVVKEA